jgi:D-aminopeptidase
LLRVDGVPVGRELGSDVVPLPGTADLGGAGSIIVIIATDAPLLPMQCRRLAQRATLGIARMGGIAANGSGDIILAFSTANRCLEGATDSPAPFSVRMVPNLAITPLFEATAEAVEEAILNALCAAVTTTGINGRTAHALPLAKLCDVLRAYNRLT